MRIDPANKPILSYPDTHPAKLFLLAHQGFNRKWVGFEIGYSNGPSLPDLMWNSILTDRIQRLSGLLYKYVSYTPVLHQWLNPTSTLSDLEQQNLNTIDLVSELINEAERMCADQIQAFHKEMFKDLRELLQVWNHSITQRIEFQQGGHHV